LSTSVVRAAYRRRDGAAWRLLCRRVGGHDVTTNLRLAALASLAFTTSACMATIDDSGGGDVGEAIVGGSFEPNYKFPWEVSLNGCHGVLIDPSWVLTAAHCVPTNGWSRKVSFTRTDPYSGTVKADSRTVTPGYGAVFINDGYVLGNGFNNPVNDIALIRLDSPFAVDQNIQTVAIPTTPRVVGTAGAIAGGGSTVLPPAGDDAVMRTTIPSVNPSTCSPPAGAFCLSSPTAGVCPGDSGSGFVTVEGGRAVVRGIASFMNASASCTSVSASDYLAVTDVFSFHDWILKTMGRDDVSLAGSTRVHWSGHTARGVVGLGCTNPDGTMYAPTNVVGTRIGANCAAGDTEVALCSISAGQTDPLRPLPIVITRFTMTTTTASGSTTTALPISNTFASYSGAAPAGVVRDFNCEIGLGSLTIGGGAVTAAQPQLSRLPDPTGGGYCLPGEVKHCTLGPPPVCTCSAPTIGLLAP
jgi:hypothetical protein